ncbi:MAG: hypothetical protein Q7T24_06845 [Deltaproteobacteria bacterium]|nr:hypothetical protein [Deltaproteobacteria bacterium]
MQRIKKGLAVFLAFTFFFALSARAVMAEDSMQRTLNDSLYGGLIGALLGTAVLLLTENPDDHLSYIPTGAGIGILVGAAYGLATSGVVERAGAEVEDGRVTFNMPTVKKEKFFDEKINKVEEIESIDLIRVNF